MPYTILIADDSELEQMYVDKILRAHFSGINLLVAYDGKVAVDMAKEHLPDIILMDIEMPKVNGIKALRHLKQNKITQHIPVIVFTATSDFIEAFDAGAIDFIHKPFNNITLITRIKSTIKLVDAYNAIQRQRDEIEAKTRQIQRQHESVVLQRDIIQKKNREILADLRYSRRIQQAVMPDKEIKKLPLSEYFILNKPQNIVGGDFYWLTEAHGKILIAVGDCTGHGVSGALMHMLGTVYLSRIVRTGTYQTPGDILFQLREEIIRSLHQTGKTGETQDGMDLAICIMDKEQKSLTFAGANNPLYYIQNGELNEIKGDRMPVGIHINKDWPFTNHQLKLENVEAIYLFSDGYADQFGGPKGKKFRYKQFKQLLTDIYLLNFEKQKHILEKTFIKWKGELEQIDDVLVAGIKITPNHTTTKKNK